MTNFQSNLNDTKTKTDFSLKIKKLKIVSNLWKKAV